MPCQSAPSKEEMEFHEEYKNNPIFKREIDERRALYDSTVARFNSIIDKITQKNSFSDLEKVAFDSFMTVFLCKAMDIIGSNNMMQFTYPDMEWWYKEHKSRDKNGDKSLLLDSEIQENLERINKKYKVNG